MDQRMWEKMMTNVTQLRSEAQNLLDPDRFSKFEEKFREIRTQSRADEHGMQKWDMLVIELLLIINTRALLTARFHYYLLSHNISMNCEIVFVFHAHRRLDQANYSSFLRLMGAFIGCRFVKLWMNMFFYHLLEKVWRFNDLTHWLRILARARFPGLSDHMCFMTELRPFLDTRSFHDCKRMINLYHFFERSLSYEKKVEVLKYIVAKYFPDNETLFTKFLLCETGGWVSFTPPRSNVPSSAQPARHHRMSNNSPSTPLDRHHRRSNNSPSTPLDRHHRLLRHPKRENRVERARVALNFDSVDGSQTNEKNGEMKEQKSNEGQPSAIGKVEERRSKRVKGECGKSDGEEMTEEERRSETEKRQKDKGKSEMMEQERRFKEETVKEKEGGLKRENGRRRSVAEKRRLDCEKVEEKGGERKRITSEGERIIKMDRQTGNEERRADEKPSECNEN